MKKELSIQIISGLLILLFAYASLTKLLEFQRFRQGLAHSPLIGKSADFVSWFIPLIELLICYLLFRPGTRRLGLLSSFTLMCLFTGYIAYMLLFVTIRPCGCGGVLQHMSWPQHLVFNIFFTLLPLLGVLLSRGTVYHDKSASRSSVAYS